MTTPSQHADRDETGADAPPTSRQCWQCGYGLHGLTEPSCCPECGRPVPRLLLACRARDGATHNDVILGILGLVALVVVFLVRDFSRDRFLPQDILPFAGIAALLVVSAWRLSRRRWRPDTGAREIFVTDDGIEVIRVGTMPTRIRASVIASVVVVSNLVGSLKCVRVGFGQAVVVHSVIGHLWAEDAERLATAIRALIDARKSSPPSHRVDAAEPPYPDAIRSEECTDP